MTDKTEKIKMVKYPVNGIDFYISQDQTIKGISQSGVGLLSGWSETSMRRIVKCLEFMGSPAFATGKIPEDLEIPSFLEKYFEKRDVPEILNTFIEEGFIVRQTVTQSQAKIMKSSFCEAWTCFCAFIADDVKKEVREQSTQSYRKFAQNGIDDFILKITGAIEDSSEKRITQLLQQVIDEVKESKEIAHQFRVLQQNTQTYAPGLQDLNKEYGDEDLDQLYLPGDKGEMSIEGWLYSKGIHKIDDSFYRSFRRRAVDIYRALVKVCPEKKHFMRKNGKKQYNVFVYQPVHFPILERAFEETLRMFKVQT